MQHIIIIVGAGLYGATAARLAAERGERVLVLERRRHIAGNCFDEQQDGILVHKYGAHIFHTDKEEVWHFVSRFATFNAYTHKVVARFEGREYTLPFNLNTIRQVYGLDSISIEKAQELLEQEHRHEYYPNPANLEQQAINLVGRRLYEMLVKGYTEKQWGLPATMLSPDIIRRLPVRMNFDDRYFSDSYQGLPIGGYTRMVERMLEGIEVRMGVDFLTDINYWCGMAKRIVYTGMVDELLSYELGALPYRSLHFETETLPVQQFQQCAVVNETSATVPYTRTIEHKAFGNAQCLISDKTVVTREFPTEWEPGREAFYPVNNAASTRLYNDYCQLLHQRHPNISLGGRLGLYRYLDMDDTIELVMKIFGYYKYNV